MLSYTGIDNIGTRAHHSYLASETPLPNGYLKTRCVIFILFGSQNSNKDYYKSRPMGKPTICICENKGTDQLRS